MILADKIIELRKKAGLSQEELAEKMGVSRQSVSKWEGALSIPDLDKILLLSEIFGVSTDYLLKDELGDEIPAPKEEISESHFRKVTMEEANDFIKVKDETAPMVALGVALCILSPIIMFFLISLYESGKTVLNENAAGGIGIIALVLFVVPAVALFITSGMKTSKYEYLEKEPIELAYGVSGMVKERQNKLRDKHIRDCVIGICLCVLAAIPLFIGAFFEKADGEVLIGLCLTIMIVAAGVYILIRNGIPWTATEKLLQQDDYSIENKRIEKKLDPIATIYWCAVTAAYLGWSFYTFEWHRTWIIWPVAAVFYGVFYGIAHYMNKK
ncbi:MAG: helix-turn-helix transcriptional regulator [Oscillospiraceae bacterium]|nr:helix-turn-helix transcriptional regulator [Oscillospiraceae bacterium]